MEKLLCDAALRGDLELLHEIIAKDNYILDKVLVGSFKGKNPLHVATSTGQAEFVLKLLEIKPKLAEVIDTELGAALHIASANGDVKIVEALLEHSPKMCMARNRDGYNPLHIAAMEGKVDVLKKLVQICPFATQVILDRGDTILHLCVKYDQLKSLELLVEMIRDPRFVNSQDAEGNNILHVAVFCKRREIVEFILDRTPINKNAVNEAGWTARDINFIVQNRTDPEQVDDINFIVQNRTDPEQVVNFVVQNRTDPEQVDEGIGRLLRAAGVRKTIEGSIVFEAKSPPSVENFWQTLMVVSSLFATMAFQVGVNPPGGIWQDDSQEHLAGKAILAYKYHKSYLCFIFLNTLGFLLSLYAIIILVYAAVQRLNVPRKWLLLWLPVSTIMTTLFAYTYSVYVVSPKHMMTATITILLSVIVWMFSSFCIAVMMVFLVTRKKARGSLLVQFMVRRLRN